MKKLLTAEQINKKYNNRYVEVSQTYNYEKQYFEYNVLKTSSVIKENMTLGQDLGTELEYRR